MKRRIQGNEIMEKTGTGNKTTPMNTDLMFRAVNYDKWTYTLQTHMHARAHAHKSLFCLCAEDFQHISNQPCMPFEGTRLENTRPLITASETESMMGLKCKATTHLTHKQRNTNASISLAAVLARSGWIILGRKNKMHTQIRAHKNGLSN